MLGLITGSVGAIVLNLLKGGTEYLQENQKMQQDKLDKVHELKLLDRQFQIQANIENAKADAKIGVADAEAYASTFASREFSIRAMMKSDIWIVKLLSGIIRPVTTISYTLIFFFALYVSYSYAAIENLPITEFMYLPVMAAFIELNYMIISFWFMNREFSKSRK